MKIQILILVAALALSGCSTAKQEPAVAATPASGASGQTSAVKQYSIHGKILAVDAANKSAKIDAGPIGDWMGAMAMNYTIKDDAGLAKLTVGSTIDATVFVDGDNFWVGDIKVAAGK